MSARPRLAFRPAPAFTVVRDGTLAGAPVLLLGHWIGADGQVEAAEVLTLSSTRRLADIAGLRGENLHDPPRFVNGLPPRQQITGTDA
jgi:hypothetical protein